jgi:phage terminase small subunit
VLEQRFVEEYLVDGNATKAATRAGLRGRDLSAAGAKMLTRRLVAAAIEQERERSMARTRITRDRVLREYARLAFAEIGDIADWDEDGMMRLKPKAALSQDDRAAVVEVATRSGKKGARARVRMHSKIRALDALAKHLGLWGKAAAPLDDAGPKLINGRDAREVLRERFLGMVASAVETEKAQ